MNRIHAALVVVGLLTVGFNAAADTVEAPKPAKLVVCRDYKIVADKSAEDRPIALCFDGKRPAVLRYFSEVTVSTSEGPAKIVVGSR